MLLYVSEYLSGRKQHLCESTVCNLLCVWLIGIPKRLWAEGQTTYSYVLHPLAAGIWLMINRPDTRKTNSYLLSVRICKKADHCILDTRSVYQVFWSLKTVNIYVGVELNHMTWILTDISFSTRRALLSLVYSRWPVRASAWCAGLWTRYSAKTLR